MLNAILLGLLRHALTTMGGAIVAHAVNFVEGVPVVHDTLTALAGAGLIAGGGILSTLHKVKTQSGPIYKVNER